MRDSNTNQTILTIPNDVSGARHSGEESERRKSRPGEHVEYQQSRVSTKLATYSLLTSMLKYANADNRAE